MIIACMNSGDRCYERLLFIHEKCWSSNISWSLIPLFRLKISFCSMRLKCPSHDVSLLLPCLIRYNFCLALRTKFSSGLSILCFPPLLVPCVQNPLVIHCVSLHAPAYLPEGNKMLWVTKFANFANFKSDYFSGFVPLSSKTISRKQERRIFYLNKVIYIKAPGVQPGKDWDFSSICKLLH